MIEKMVLHVGAEKTGSTSLQEILCKNPDWLQQTAVHYPIHPICGSIRANAKLLTFALQQDLPAVFRRNFPDTDVTGMDPAKELNLLLAECPTGTQTAVLSSELLRPHHAAHLKYLMPAGVECQIVLIVRRQDNWLQSYYSQSLKGAKNVGLDDLVDGILKSTERGYSCPDWLWQYHTWQHEFGNRSVIFYDDPVQPYQTAFFDLLGARPDRLARSTQVMNSALTAPAIAHLSSLDRSMPGDVFLQHVKACQTCSDPGKAEGGTVSLLSPKHRQKLIDRFEAGNIELAQVLGTDPALLHIPADDDDFISLHEQTQTADFARFQGKLRAHLEISAHRRDPK